MTQLAPRPARLRPRHLLPNSINNQPTNPEPLCRKPDYLNIFLADSMIILYGRQCQADNDKFQNQAKAEDTVLRVLFKYFYKLVFF